MHCAWCDFESAIFAPETFNRISHRPVSKVKYLYVEIDECIVRGRVSHGQPFPLQEFLVLCFEDFRKRARCQSNAVGVIEYLIWKVFFGLSLELKASLVWYAH